MESSRVGSFRSILECNICKLSKHLQRGEEVNSKFGELEKWVI